LGGHTVHPPAVTGTAAFQSWRMHHPALSSRTCPGLQAPQSLSLSLTFRSDWSSTHVQARTALESKVRSSQVRSPGGGESLRLSIPELKRGAGIPATLADDAVREQGHGDLAQAHGGRLPPRASVLPPASTNAPEPAQIGGPQPKIYPHFLRLANCDFCVARQWRMPR
jgi:hypothetical protein